MITVAKDNSGDFDSIQKAVDSVSDNNNETIFIKKGEKVIMKNNNLGLALSLNDFKSIFENSEFVLIKNDEEFVDVQRDIEYYSWRNK